MFKPTILKLDSLTWCWLFLVGLALLLCLLLPTVALADSPTCAKCHDAETVTWQDSPHAHAATGAVTCEDCHGTYVKGHPKNGLMQLGVDSASCQQCHAETHQQWQASSHGQSKVQCISCHLSHSQQFRLTDEALCHSCHRNQLNDFAHSTHAGADLACTDCHLSASLDETAGQSNTSATAPNHSFVVTSQACVDCHEQKAGQSAFRPAHSPNPPDEQLVDVLKGKLESAEQSNQALKGWSVTGLGFGLGIGGMLGIAFVMIAGRFSYRSIEP